MVKQTSNKMSQVNNPDEYSIYWHFWCFGLVLAVEELWQGTSLDGVQTVVVEPSRVAWHDDMMSLFCYVIIILARIVAGSRRLRVCRWRSTARYLHLWHHLHSRTTHLNQSDFSMYSSCHSYTQKWWYSKVATLHKFWERPYRVSNPQPLDR